LLTGYLECGGFESVRSAMAERSVGARWRAEMAEFF
jgi:L-rhamnose mutarotase